MMTGANTQVGNHTRTVRLRDSTIVPVAPMATEQNRNGKKYGVSGDQLRQAAVSRPECSDGCRTRASPKPFAKLGRVLSKFAKRECRMSRAAVRPQRMTVLIQKNVGACTGKPHQVAMSNQVGK